MNYPRKLTKSLKDHLKKRQITVITGMRRTGKTTLLKELLKEASGGNTLYIDLERVDNRELFSEKNYDAILHTLEQRGLLTDRKMVIGLDEIQLAPQIISVLKYLYDAYDIKFIVTGSSSYYLKNLFSESLAGRKKVFELHTLDFAEFLTFHQVSFRPENFLRHPFSPAEYERLKVFYEDYIQYGGFPEVVLARKKEDKKDLLKDIISSYINIDVKTLSDFRDQDHLYKLLKMLAGRVGSRLDYAKLSRLTGLARATVQNYVDFLEKTYVIARLPVFSGNPDREIVKAQKVYFCDNGLMNILGSVSSGAQFENAVYTQLRSKGTLAYFALKTGHEIDFILDGKTALEVKESPTKTDAGPLGLLAERAGIKSHALIGRCAVPKFRQYLWGGDIR